MPRPEVARVAGGVRPASIFATLASLNLEGMLGADGLGDGYLSALRARLLS